MGQPVRIIDLARRLIELYGKVPGTEIEIKITGLRPGEKLSEALVDTTEIAIDGQAGVIEVRDRVATSPITKARVERLESVARSGDSEAARKLIGEMLDLVRGEDQPNVIKAVS